MARTCRNRLTSFADNEHGVAAMEFGFIALPFFAILIAIFQIGLLFLAQNELETAVEKASRQLLTGQVQQNGTTQTQFIASVCANLPAFFPELPHRRPDGRRSGRQRLFVGQHLRADPDL